MDRTPGARHLCYCWERPSGLEQPVVHWPCKVCGEALGTKLQSQIFLLLAGESSLETVRETSNQAMEQFSDRDNLQRQFQYRSEVEAIKDENRIVVNDAIHVGVPFVVGGFPHSQDPPFHLNWGTFDGQIDELRISSVMRYPVAARLGIIRQTLPEAGVNIPYSVELGTDAARGDVTWKIVDARLPHGLMLNASAGRIHGTPIASRPSTALTIEAQDESGATDSHRFEMTVAKGERRTADGILTVGVCGSSLSRTVERATSGGSS